MRVYYDDNLALPHGRAHPWTVMEARPDTRYYDFVTHPELIRTYPEDVRDLRDEPPAHGQAWKSVAGAFASILVACQQVVCESKNRRDRHPTGTNHERRTCLMIRLATKADYRSIHDWLRRWHERSEVGKGASFWCNRNLIEKGQREGKLWAMIAEDRQVVAFNLARQFRCEHGSEAAIEILEVHPERRGAGLGRQMVEHFRGLARETGAMGICIDCRPHTSIPFWQHMGFSRVVPGSSEHVLLLPTLNRPALPAGSRLPVTISLSRGYPPVNEESPFVTEAVVHGERFILKDEYVRYFQDIETFAEVKVGVEVLHNYKVKYLHELGAEWCGGLARIGALHRKGSEAE